MKYTRIEAGRYIADNGMKIVRHIPKNMFTGRQMNYGEARWHIYNANGEKITDWAFTLKEAKQIVENY